MAISFELTEEQQRNQAERVKRLFRLTDEQLAMTLDHVDASSVDGVARLQITLIADVPDAEAIALLRGDPIEGRQ